jgi:hypothetical protein
MPYSGMRPREQAEKRWEMGKKVVSNRRFTDGSLPGHGFNKTDDVFGVGGRVKNTPNWQNKSWDLGHALVATGDAPGFSHIKESLALFHSRPFSKGILSLDSPSPKSQNEIGVSPSGPAIISSWSSSSTPQSLIAHGANSNAHAVKLHTSPTNLGTDIGF